jgi:hypothetical protein
MLRRWVLPGVLTALVALLFTVPPNPVAAQDGDAAEVDASRTLAERYAPIVVVKQQQADCDRRGEAFVPAPVDIVLDNPEVLLRQVGHADPVIMRAPGASDLFGLGEGFYLDFPGISLAPECIYERDFRRYAAGVPVTVYAHVAQQADRPGTLALQYWFYWYYNDWNNTHESDWEGIQLLFEASSAAEALTVEPIGVGYSQHEGGERAGWNDSQLEREGNRPVVYSSAGSHASYFSSSVFLGRSASEGFGCDDTTGPSLRTDPVAVLVPAEVDDPDDPFAWVAFGGRWGERQVGPYNGPTGMSTKDRWTRPIDWHDQLRDSSVKVPAGEGRTASTVRAFCSVVEWGSVQVIATKLSPVRTLATVAVVFLLARTAVRRTGWSRVAVLPVRARRRAGEILRATPRLYRRRPAAFALIGLIYLPVSLVVAGAVQMMQAAPVFGPLFELGGERGTLSVLLVLVAGGVANAYAYSAVSVAVARQVATLDEHAPVSGATSLREAWALWHPLLTAVLRITLIVVALLLSVVGIPFAIWFLVRYQFVGQIVGFEGRGGTSALRRSGQLVRGRWAHTALVVAVINGVVLLLSATAGLLILVIVNGFPLWMFAVTVNIVASLIVPLAAIAQTLLYGDAVAEDHDLAAAPTEPASEHVVVVEGAAAPAIPHAHS